MRLLLPPSETKRDGGLPGPLDLGQLAAPELLADRERVLTALVRYSSKPSPSVRTAIGTSPNQDAELLRNTRLRDAAVAPAHEVYDGVLFDAITLAGCTAATQRRIISSTLVQSALFGVVGFGDAIPAYRCSADSRLPRVGHLGRFWRTRLASSMHALTDSQLLLDLRSGTYASMWTPPADPERVAIVRVMQVRGGRRVAVSHFNKATKGQLVRVLNSAKREPASVSGAAEVIAAAGYDVELVAGGRHVILEVMMRAD